MISFYDKQTRIGHLITSCDELYRECPQYQYAPMGKSLFLDFETSSGDKKLKSVNPWHNCTPIGFAFAIDDSDVWFVPWHIAMEAERQTRWLWGLLQGVDEWVNHHVKYDAHVLLNSEADIELPTHLCLVCTIMLAHLMDADRSYKGGYFLDVLLKQWLHIDILHHYKKMEPYLVDNQDYGRVPIDILAEYACGDVFHNRLLYHFERKHLPPECQQGEPRLLDTEIALTKTLVQMERTGLTLDLEGTQCEEFVSLGRRLAIEEELAAMVGYHINPNSGKDKFDLICNRFGQPVLRWTNLDDNDKPTIKSNPSFDKDTLDAYINRPETPEKLRPMLLLIKEYSDEAHHASIFWVPWQKLHIDSVLHGSYNQNLRTGRMSCVEPAEQQLNLRAKRLIKPRPGYVLLSFDEEQIEYRLIVHYINDERTIAIYQANPGMDFHQYVADEFCGGIDRRPAKTINFAIAFGQGKKLTREALVLAFRKMKLELTQTQAVTRADTLINLYHKNLPSLKPTARQAEDLARERGYIRNIAGRRLHLPGTRHNIWYNKKGELIDRCHIALCGRCVQSTAADVMKERAVAITEQGGILEAVDGELIALVHDEFLIQIPDGTDEEVTYAANEIRRELEFCPFPFKVPLRCSGGWSRDNWADTKNHPLERVEDTAQMPSERASERY